MTQIQSKRFMKSAFANAKTLAFAYKFGRGLVWR